MMTRLLMVVVMLAASLLGVGLTAAPAFADAPNTCLGARTDQPQGRWLHETIGSSADQDWYRFTTRAKQHALITLGGLSGNLSLSLYNGSCRRIAAVDHAGNRFEELYRYLSAGRYFVRVSGAPSPYDLQFRPLPNRVFILSAHGYVQSGYLHIPGEVLNNTGTRRRFIEVDATFYNASGRVIGTDFTYSHVDVAAPFHRAPFEILDSVPAGYHHYKLTVSSDTTGVAPVGKLTLKPGVPYTNSIGYRIFPGEVRNGNSFRVNYTKVVGVIYGSHGNVLYEDFTYTNPARIAAGRTAPYQLEFPSTAGSNGMASYVSASRG
jgi:hypothetical protein